MQGSEKAQNKMFYGRLEERVLQKLPSFVTPLRFKIFIGYFSVLLLAIYGWDHITSAWRYLATLFAPAIALLGALIALKLSVVLVSILTLVTAMLKGFFGFLVMVLKPGILKAIFVPQLVSLASWVHRKSTRLQTLFKKLFHKFKAMVDMVIAWWKKQLLIDKILLSGFLIPLLVILLVVFIIERAIAIFAIKKATEQVVQKSTKFVISNFHRIPVIGSIPSSIAASTRKFTRKKDRDDVADDLKNLSNEMYLNTVLNQPEEAEPNQPEPNKDNDINQ